MLQAERRQTKRNATLKKGKIVFNNAMCTVECTIKDLSSSGAGLELPLWEDLPEDFVLVIAGGTSRHCEVAWSANNRLGVQFVDAESAPLKTAHLPAAHDTAREAGNTESLLARIDDIQRQLDALRAEIEASA